MADQITVNGVEYASVEEMPAEVRALHEQGMAMLDAMGPGTTEVEQQSFTVNGQSYASLDDMPAAERAMFQDSMGSMDGMLGGGPASPRPEAEPAAPEPTSSSDPVYVDETNQSSGSGFVKGLIVGVVLLGAAIALYVFLTAS